MDMPKYTTGMSYTDFTDALGRGIAGLIATSVVLGHADPGGSLDYIAIDKPEPAVDFVVWLKRRDGWEEARDRLLAVVDDLKIAEHAVQQIPIAGDPE